MSYEVVPDPQHMVMGQTIDSDNTAFRTDAEGATQFVGTWAQTRSLGIVRQLVVLASNVPAGLGGTFVFEYGEDGATAEISETRTIDDFETVRDFDLLNSGEYFRVKFTPSRALAPGEFVAITTTQRRQNDGAFVRLANQEIEEANAAMGQTFAYGKAFDAVTEKSVNLRPFNAVHTAEQTPTSLAIDEEFIGDGWIDTLQIGHYLFLIAGIESFASVELQWSNDEAAVVATTTLVNVPTVAGPLNYNVYLNITSTFTSGRYLRVRIVNGGVAQSAPLLTGIFTTGKDPYSPLIGINADVSLLASAVLTRSVLAGARSDGTVHNLALREGNALSVDAGSTVAVFGDLVASGRRDQLQVNFAEQTPLNKVAVTTVGTGTVSNVTAQSIVSTGATASSSAIMQTRRTVQYRPGHELYAYFTATFSAPTANGYQFIGLIDDDDGFALGYQGLDFCVRRRRGGADTDVVQADFNGELLTRFNRDDVVEAINPQLGNVYRIRFGWLGNAPIKFEVLSPDGQWIVLHAIKYPNTAVTAHIDNPDLPLRSEVRNGADAVITSIATSSWSAGVTIGEQPLETIYQKKTPEDSALPSGSAITVDPVLNVEANVFDSGWIAVTDNYPGGQLLTIQADVSLNVYLMNASDDQGSNIEGSGFYTLVTTANAPSVSGAPFFDDYFRLIIENTSGASATAFTARSQGYGTTTPAPIYQSLDQPVFGFIPAPVTQSVIKGQQPGDSGLYVSQRLGGVYTFNPAQTPLGISGVYTSEVIDVNQYPTALLTVNTDQASTVNGLLLEWSDTVAFTTVRSSRTDTFRLGDATAGKLLEIRSRARYMRIKFTNGGIAQTRFNLGMLLSPIPLAARVQLGSTRLGQTGQLDVALTAQRIAPGPVSNRGGIRLKNMSSSARPLFYGFSVGLTVVNGDELAVGEAIELDVDEFVEIYVITTSTGGGGVRCSWTEIGY